MQRNKIDSHGFILHLMLHKTGVKCPALCCGTLRVKRKTSFSPLSSLNIIILRQACVLLTWPCHLVLLLIVIPLQPFSLWWKGPNWVIKSSEQENYLFVCLCPLKSHWLALNGGTIHSKWFVSALSADDPWRTVTDYSSVANRDQNPNIQSWPKFSFSESTISSRCLINSGEIHLSWFRYLKGRYHFLS